MADINKAAGILIKDRKLLLEKSFGVEMYMSPGGKIEPDETAKQALVRELREEFQIVTVEEDFEEFGIYSAEIAGKPGKTVHMTVFVVKKWNGDPTPSNEVEEVLWFSTSMMTSIKTGSIFEHEVIPRLKQKNLID